MNIQLRRLDPNVPDPVESRRSATGRFVRLIYAVGVIGVLSFFLLRFSMPLVFLGGPGIVSAPREIVSLPYIVQVQRMDVTPGARVEAGAPIALIQSPQFGETLSNLTRAGRRDEPRGGAARQGASVTGFFRRCPLAPAPGR